MTTTAFILSVYEDGEILGGNKVLDEMEQKYKENLIYSPCVLRKICIRGKCIWPIFVLLIVSFAKLDGFRTIEENAYAAFEHTVVLHTSIINACSSAMVYVSPFVVSIVLFKTRKKIRVLEKSPLFARWKNEAKPAVITLQGCIK